MPITRRGVLSALPMALAGGATKPVPLPTEPPPDAELIRLGEAFEAAWRRQDEEHALIQHLEQTVENEDVVCAAWWDAIEVAGGLMRQIMECRAMTIQGFRVKARALAWARTGDLSFDPEVDATDMQIALGIVRDLIGE